MLIEVDKAVMQILCRYRSLHPPGMLDGRVPIGVALMGAADHADPIPGPCVPQSHLLTPSKDNIVEPSLPEYV